MISETIVFKRFSAGGSLFMDLKDESENKAHAKPWSWSAPQSSWNTQTIWALLCLDGQNRAIVITESLARVDTAIPIIGIRWRSRLPSKTEISPHRPCVRCAAILNRAIGVRWCNILVRENYLPPPWRPIFGRSREGYGRYAFPVFSRIWVSTVDLGTQSSILLSGGGGR